MYIAGVYASIISFRIVLKTVPIHTRHTLIHFALFYTTISLCPLLALSLFVYFF